MNQHSDSHRNNSYPLAGAGPGYGQRPGRGRAPWGLSVCRDQVITSAAAFAVVRHALGGPRPGWKTPAQPRELEVSPASTRDS